MEGVERALAELREHLLEMGTLAEAMILKSVKAVVARDDGLVEAVLAHEQEMDPLCIAIDDRCVTLLARHRPEAPALRFVVAAIKINADLERIGDLCVSIALRARSLLVQAPVKPLTDIPRLAVLAGEMVNQSLDAFVRRDPELARSVIEADDRVDRLHDQVSRELLAYMTSDPAVIGRALDLLITSRNLERIADHATNIAEDVIFVDRGEDVRERGDKELKRGLRRSPGPGAGSIVSPSGRVGE
jgi:phosphate transport system protein